jgi:hypothetical protein
MLIIFLKKLFPGLKFLCRCLAKRIHSGMSLMLWHQLSYHDGLHRFRRIARTVPFLTPELRLQLNLRNWVKRLSKATFKSASTLFLPSFLCLDFLFCRYGRHIFDFYKTLSLSDVSPPAIA